ncbi:sensor domain-containing diguanylate cyclase [Virgibacillus sp. MG-45]|uniref:sensor domain-containing diguanylate cyclase n=1 Tax=Virgibacillus sp. MG-45 TaxID=3102791 RepID=UPI002ED8B45B
MVDKWKISALWFAWLLFWPAILWVSYHFYFINLQGNITDIALFTFFIIVVAFFPLTINSVPIFFINGISIAVFLAFGLFVEIIVTLIAVLFVILKVGIKRKVIYRIPLNMLLFSAGSLLAASVYQLLGGTYAQSQYQSYTEMIAIIVYAVIIVAFNHLFSYLVRRFFYRQSARFFDRGLKWELFSFLLVIPTGFALYILYEAIGIRALLFIGIPYISISVILKLLYSYKEINYYLKRTGDIGHRLARRLEEREVYDVFLREIKSVLPYDTAYIYLVSKDEAMKLVTFSHNDLMEASEALSPDMKETFSKKTMEMKLPLVYQSEKDWKNEDIQIFPSHTQSVLSMPIQYEKEVIGVFTCISTKEKEYESMHVRIADILSNYLGVAIENAKNYEVTKTRSERDALTKLFNYRYMENVMKHKIEASYSTDTGNEFSLLLVDLDHFKLINDSYGHEAGNEVLCQISNLLTAHIDANGIVGRYGGEEFMILLLNTKSNEAINIGETVRKTIEATPFSIQNHLLPAKKPLTIQVTASIGVSSFPYHGLIVSDLVRHADRALYIGAKKKGRNRVAFLSHDTEENVF